MASSQQLLCWNSSPESDNVPGHLHNSHQCDQCPKNFTNKCYLDRHIRKFHEGVKYSCELCDKKFTETWSLKSHVLGVHEKLKRFKCNQCDKAYPQASGLSQHKRKIHPEEKSNKNQYHTIPPPPKRYCQDGELLYSFNPF